MTRASKVALASGVIRRSRTKGLLRVYAKQIR